MDFDKALLKSNPIKCILVDGSVVGLPPPRKRKQSVLKSHLAPNPNFFGVAKGFNVDKLTGL